MSDSSPPSHSSTPQLEELQETLFSTEEEPSKLLVRNYRAPQPLNQRTVFASFIQGDCPRLGKGDEKLGDSVAGAREPLGRKGRLGGEGAPRTCLDWEYAPPPRVPGDDLPQHRGIVCCSQLAWGAHVPLTHVFFPYSGILVYYR